MLVSLFVARHLIYQLSNIITIVIKLCIPISDYNCDFARRFYLLFLGDYCYVLLLMLIYYGVQIGILGHLVRAFS